MLWNLKEVQLHNQETPQRPRCWSLRTDMEAERALNAALAERQEERFLAMSLPAISSLRNVTN